MKTLVEVKGLSKHFVVGRKTILKAVDNIDFHINEGETLGLVGESGCGKSTTGKLLVNILNKTTGEIIYDGERLDQMDRKLKKAYQLNVQMIFQDPYASLNPRMKVLDIVAEGIRINKLLPLADQTNRVYELLEIVGLSREHADRYAHEFSGGQRQRIGIARALSMNPKFIVCDEPISALDVSIQAQIVNLLNDLQEKLGLTYLFIAHDINMVRLISDRIAVMYLGNIVEVGSSHQVFFKPTHPYTKALISAVPKPNPAIERKSNRILLEGDVPSPLSIKPGCVFVDRCRYKTDVCVNEKPLLVEVTSGIHVACHHNKNLSSTAI